MRKKIYALGMFLISAVSISYAQEGTYSGELDVQGQKLPIVFHFLGNGCTMDSPAQGAKGIKAEWEHDAEGKVNISMPNFGIRYEGRLVGQTIEGTFKQNGFGLPLTLTAGEKQRNRPQTPIAPFPYTTEEVSFSSSDAVLHGTLTLPSGYTEKSPVVLMITGSGQQSRDEELFEHKPFAVIADALARQGIASLRYDDRGFGESTGSLEEATTETFKQDAAAGLEMLRKRFRKVGVLGHSEGGTIALMLANERKTDFIVTLAAMVISGKETLVMQTRGSLSGSGVPDAMLDALMPALERGYEAISEGKSPESIDMRGVPDSLKPTFLQIIQSSSSPWMRYFIKLDGRNYLSRIKCPVLALNGKKDMQVNYEPNIEALEKGLKSKHKALALEGLNHLFQHCSTGAVTEYLEIEETISPEVLEEICSWIKAI